MTTYSGLLPDYIGQGVIADRPATPTGLNPDIATLWFATDTNELSAWDSVDSVWVDVAGGIFTRSINNQTASYTAVLADATKYVRLANAAAINFTVPANASVGFTIGTEIPFVQSGAGQVTVVASGGVTVNSPETLKLRQQWSAATMIKVATNTWDLIGDLELI